MSDPSRTVPSHPSDPSIANSLYASGLALNPTMTAMGFANSLNPNYQFLMRLSELSSKIQPTNQSLGFSSVPHNNFLQPTIPNLTQTLPSSTAGNELMNNFNWLQYAQLLSCGSLNNLDPTNSWNPSNNGDQMWKAIQSLYSDLYNPMGATSINANHNFQSPLNNLNMPQFFHCESQESFNDVLAKLGHGLNASKRREEVRIPDLLRDPVIQSAMNNRIGDTNNERLSNTGNSFDSNQTDMLRDIPLSLQNSFYSKSQSKEFSRNSSPVFSRTNSSNPGRGRGRPPKSLGSRSSLSFNETKNDSLNYLNVFEKPYQASGSTPITSCYLLGESTSRSSPSSNLSVAKSSIPITSHVSSKLVIPPTITSMPRGKISPEVQEDSKIYNTPTKKVKEEQILKFNPKKSTSSTSSIEGTIDDVLKSFQNPNVIPNNSTSPLSNCALKPSAYEIMYPEDLTNGKKWVSKNPATFEGNKRDRIAEPILPNYQKPLKNGWKRETYLKSLNELVGDVIYETPSGTKVNGIPQLREVMSREKITNVSTENFSFEISLQLGDYLKPSFDHILGFEKLSTEEVDLIFNKYLNINIEENISVNNSQCQYFHMENDFQSNSFNNCSKKMFNNHKKNDGKPLKPSIKSDKYKHKKVEQKLIEAHISKELKKPVEDLRLLNSQTLPTFEYIEGNKLSKSAFNHCLVVSEFLYSFADVLGIDLDTIPTMQDYQMAFVNRDPDSLHTICWLLMELLKFAVCDPGITNTKLITQVIGVKFSELEVNLNTLSGVLRAFILARAVGNESEMEAWLINTEYKDLSEDKQAELLGFVINEMLTSRLISSEVDKILEQQSIIRRDKWILDGKLRRLKLFQSRKLYCTNGTISNNINSISNNNITCVNNTDSQIILDADCNISVADVDSDLDSVDSNENMTNSQLNWSGEEDETASSSSLDDLEKRIERLTNQVLQKKNDLNQCDHKLRGIHLGQDRYHRNFYLLKHLGGIFIEPAPSSLELSIDPDYILKTINQSQNEKPIKQETFEDNKDVIQHSFSIQPISNISSDKSRKTNELKVELFTPTDSTNVFYQIEPLDLRKSSKSCDLKLEIKNELTIGQVSASENGKVKLPKIEWDINVINNATVLYANRARLIYPEIEFEQLKNYYRQQIEDYLRDCNQSNAMEHLKSWIDFYQLVLKTDQLNGETNNYINIQHSKSDRIKDLADKELERMGKQSPKKLQLIPNSIKDKWCWIRDEEQIKKLLNSLHRRGIRERSLYRSIERHYKLIVNCFRFNYSAAFNYDCHRNSTKLRVTSKRGKGRGSSHNQIGSKISLAQSLINDIKSEPGEQHSKYLSEITALEKVEDLISMVVTASLHKKGWKFPEKAVFDDTIKVIPSDTLKRFNFEMYPLDLAKERLLELEDQLERRYLLPPLNWEFKPKVLSTTKESHLRKTLNDVVSSSCGFEDGADSTSSFIDDTRSINTDQSPSAQMSQDTDNKKLSTLASKLESVNSSVTPPELAEWRKSILEANNDKQLLACMRTLTNAIAWDKSIMKVLCQICRKDCNEAQLLLCDSCDQGYHTYCFRPPLSGIPEGQWFCHDCVSKATDQKLCYVCGQPKTARTTVCMVCKRMLHAICAKPSMTRVPRKWTCHNCSGRMSKDVSTENDTNLLPSLTVSLSNCSELSVSCPNSNSSTTTSDFNAAYSSVKQSLCSNIAFSNILYKKRSCKRVLDSQNAGAINKKRIKRISTDTKSNKSISSDCSKSKNDWQFKESSSGKDEKSPSVDAVEIEIIKTLLTNHSPVPSNSTLSQTEFENCRKFLLEILDLNLVYPFLRPVDVKKVPIYKKVIKTPMDFSTLARKLSDFVYKSINEFLSDLRLIFNNCEQFNEDDSDIGKAGHALRAFFEKHWMSSLSKEPEIIGEMNQKIFVRT